MAERSSAKFEDQVNASLKNRPKQRPASGQDYVVGFEYQLLDDALNPDARNGLTHRTGALYEVFPPSYYAATRPVGEFNHSLLVVRGLHVEHWLNGVKVVTPTGRARGRPSLARRWGRVAGLRSPGEAAAAQMPHLPSEPRQRSLVPQRQDPPSALSGRARRSGSCRGLSLVVGLVGESDLTSSPAISSEIPARAHRGVIAVRALGPRSAGPR